jgi:hypothetical protein
MKKMMSWKKAFDEWCLSGDLGKWHFFREDCGFYL